MPTRRSSQDTQYLKSREEIDRIMRQGNRNMRRMMGRMGMDMNEITDVQEVTIKTETKEMVITKPSVSEVKSKDNVIFVVTADGYEEREVERPSYSEEDVQILCMRANVDEETAIAALTEADGELATALLTLQTR